MRFRSTTIAIGVACCIGGTASAMTDAELNEMSAFIINANGFLCAEVTSITPASGPDDYLVRCVENRDGSGRVSYIMNARAGTARQN